MIIFAIKVMALSLLALGLWQLGSAAYLADQHYWHYLTTAPVGDLAPLMEDGIPVQDPHRFLIERGCYGAVMTVIALGFAYIAWRLSGQSD